MAVEQIWLRSWTQDWSEPTTHATVAWTWLFSSLMAGSNICCPSFSSFCDCSSWSKVIWAMTLASCSKFLCCICTRADPRAILCWDIPKVTKGNVSCFRKQQSKYWRVHVMWSRNLTGDAWSASIPPQPYGKRVGYAFSKKLGLSGSMVISLWPLVSSRGLSKSLTRRRPCLTEYPPSRPSFHRFARPHFIISLAVSFDKSVSIVPETCSRTTSGLSAHCSPLEFSKLFN